MFTITNFDTVANDFTFNVTLPISPQIIGGSLTGGSLSVSLMDLGGGATFSHISGVSPPPMYMSRIDGNDYISLTITPDVTTTSTTVSGPVEFGTPIPSLVGPDVPTEIEIELNARVSAGDIATIVALFEVQPIPEPATMSLVVAGAMGVLLRRRRRR